jgi:PAS domain S-box-containing protein
MLSRNKQASVLIVDDDLTMRILMRECLEPCGYTVIEASNGLEAIDQFNNHHPDMILMDVQMPVMDGFTACKNLRKIHDCSTVPILIITGLDDINSIEEAYHVGATDFITKPLDWLILQHRVRYMLRASYAFVTLRNQEASLAHAQRLAKMGNWELDLTTSELKWSDETYRIFQKDPNTTSLSLEVLNSAIHPDDRSLVEEAFNQALDNHDPYRITHRLLLSDGTVKYVEEQCETHYDDQDNPIKSIGTVQDITEQVLAQKRIQTLSQAVEQSPVSVMITDTNSHIEYANRAFVNNTGYTRADALHKHTSILNSDHTNKRLLKDLWQTIRSGSTWHGEMQVKRKDGSTFWARANIAPVFDESQSIRNFLFMAEDISRGFNSLVQRVD